MRKEPCFMEFNVTSLKCAHPMGSRQTRMLCCCSMGFFFIKMKSVTHTSDVLSPILECFDVGAAWGEACLPCPNSATRKEPIWNYSLAEPWDDAAVNWLLVLDLQPSIHCSVDSSPGKSWTQWPVFRRKLMNALWCRSCAGMEFALILLQASDASATGDSFMMKCCTLAWMIMNAVGTQVPVKGMPCVSTFLEALNVDALKVNANQLLQR